MPLLLPEQYGGGTITVRLHGNADDEKRRFNRTENIRQIPRTDPDSKRLYRRRNNAESINRALDDTLCSAGPTRSVTPVSTSTC